MEFLHHTDKQFYIVIFARNQMSSTEINPFQLRKPMRKLFFYMLKRALEHVCPTLTVAMAMKASDITRQRLGQFIRSNTKTCTWCARII